MKRILEWLAINTIFVIALYFALFENVIGAQRLVIFFTWFTAISALMVMHPDTTATLRKTGRAIPAWIDAMYDAAVLGLLVWFGWWWTAIGYLIHVSLLFVVRSGESDE